MTQLCTFYVVHYILALKVSYIYIAFGVQSFGVVSCLVWKSSEIVQQHHPCCSGISVTFPNFC